MRDLGTYFAALWAEDGPQVVLAMAVSAIAALTEGALLLLLAPLLSLAGLMGNVSMTGGLAKALQAIGLFDIVDRVGEGGLIGLWIAAAIAVSILSSYRELKGQVIQEHFAVHMRQRFQSAAMSADWMALQRESSSDLVVMIADTLARAAEGTAALIHLGARLLAVLIQIAVALVVAPGPCGIAVAVGCLLMPFQAIRLRRAFRKGRESTRGGHAVQAIVSDHVAAIKLAKAHGTEGNLTAHFLRALDRLKDQRILFLRERVLARTGFRVAALLGFAVVIWISVALLHATGAALLVLVAVFARLVPMLSEMLHHAHMLAEALASWTEAESLFTRLDAVAEPKTDAGLACPVGPIRFEAVSLTWPGRATAAIDSLSLVLKDRRTTAIVGPSGAGKSTIADLALGLLVPSAGRILVGDADLQGPYRAAWHQGAAYVPQTDVLFNDSLRANLLWARPDVDDEALWRALKTAALDEVVRGLPQGLDTVLGDRGSHLSGGERQRLALARAVLRNPSFLVLDEATSHLDDASERLIQEAMNRIQHSVTLLVIAHRLQTIRNADWIIVVESGRITEQGTWDDLAGRPRGWLARTARTNEWSESVGKTPSPSVVC